MDNEHQLTFTTTLIGDTVRVGAADLLVVQKLQTERRLVLRPLAASSRWDGRDRHCSEFEYNSARPVLVQGKGRP